MSIYCVVFDLQHPREEYAQFFSHLDEHQGTLVSPHCRLVYSHNSADVVMRYLENFIYPDDTVFVGEMALHWALNHRGEATQWLSELQPMSFAPPMPVPEVTHNPPSA